MGTKDENRFQDFFEEGKYIVMKNYLYNYLLRKRAVEKSVKYDESSLLLEVGSGISPVMTLTDKIVYSDLSFTALKISKESNKKGMYVVADALNLPFKDGSFTHTISSEVLEHLPDDKTAVKELARVMKKNGCFTVTFPHRKFYFTNDDLFVEHFRRYELSEMEDILKEAGLTVVKIKKVLGPLEKITMSFIVFCFTIVDRFKSKKKAKNKSSWLISMLLPFFKWSNFLFMWLAWLDSKIMPRSLSTILLIESVLKDDKS